ncbi:MAG: hypothetical protein E7287_02175 [Lachnospiraceae bacterium]|nr:hypothetical protein [Lachnospiraceae bacterium]
MIKAIIFDAFGTLFQVTSGGSGFERTDRIFVKNLFVMAHYQRLGLCRGNYSLRTHREAIFGNKLHARINEKE